MSSAVVPAAPAFLADVCAEHTIEIVFDNRNDAFSHIFPFVVTSPPFTAIREWRITVQTSDYNNYIDVGVYTEMIGKINSKVSLYLYGKFMGATTLYHEFSISKSTLESNREWTESGKLSIHVEVHEREFKAKPRVVYAT